jgi:hypothetical protein
VLPHTGTSVLQSRGQVVLPTLDPRADRLSCMRVYKEYPLPFVLEETKLNRIVDTIHESLPDHPHGVRADRFDVFLPGTRTQQMGSVQEVLSLDNSRAQKISRLVITCSATTAGAPRPDHEVQVDFAGPTAHSSTSGTPGTPPTAAKVVAISVSGDSAVWANRTLSEVEEQVERTRQHQTAYSQTVLLLLLIGGLLLVASILLPLRSSDEPWSTRMWLRGADLDRVQEIVEQHRTITDEELREVVTMQLRNVLAAERPMTPPPPPPSSMRETLSMLVPTLILLACAALLLAYCYPTAVFLWGDEIAQYDRLLQRRKILWATIVAMTITGLGSKFLFEGIASRLSHGP